MFRTVINMPQGYGRDLTCEVRRVFPYIKRVRPIGIYNPTRKNGKQELQIEVFTYGNELNIDKNRLTYDINRIVGGKGKVTKAIDIRKYRVN